MSSNLGASTGLFFSEDTNNCRERLIAWVSRIDASRLGKKVLNSSRDKNEKARTVVGRGEKSLLCDPGSELRLWRERDRSAKIINGMEKINK